ncbi:MAG: sulfatase family protein, partial [Planctomycetota bacterium]
MVIFIDDMGYADIGPFGAEDIETPNLDRMAEEGMRFTDFTVPSSVCSASRAALLTGCYNRRVSISGALGPRATHGIHADEVTIAEICKQEGYATACFGKWHLGHHPKFLPLQHGFDEYYGLPYSNDMWPFHPDYADFPEGTAKRKKGYPDLPIIEGNRVVDDEVSGPDQEQLTTAYTERSVEFIEKNRDKPFFLYVPHSMVHVPLFVSGKYRGKSKQGLYGDVVMELDWSVGEIIGAIDRNGLTENTLVVFTSDNGPWLSYGDHAGTAGPFREGKGTQFEGGVREPTIMRWPGKIPAGSECGELASTIDLLPTVAALISAELPAHKIDGKDIRPLIFGEEGARSPHESFYGYYAGGQLQTVRDRRWKLHLPHGYRSLGPEGGGSGGKPNPYQQLRIELSLFDLEEDPGETRNVAAANPEVVERLLAQAELARQDLGDKLTEREGTGRRPHGKLEEGDE